MAEYIERGALLKHKMPVYGAYDSSLTFEAVPVPYIKGTPIANVQEVRHGKWVKSNVFGEDPIECDCCGNSVSVYGYHYCPHCGAKMDKECKTK